MTNTTIDKAPVNLTGKDRKLTAELAMYVWKYLPKPKNRTQKQFAMTTISFMPYF